MFTKSRIKKKTLISIFFIFCRIIEFCMLFQMVPGRKLPLRSKYGKRAWSLKLTSLTTLLIKAPKVAEINDFNDLFGRIFSFTSNKAESYDDCLQVRLNGRFKLTSPQVSLGDQLMTLVWLICSKKILRSPE